MKRTLLEIAAVLAVGATLASGASAQDFPTRAMQFVVPFPPGGGNDLISRVVSEGLSKTLGQPVVVLNRPGQANSVAGEIVAGSAPDSHTFMLAGPAFATNPFLYTDLPFDVTKLEPVALLTVQRYILTVNAKVEANSLEQFVELLRMSPQGFDFATYGWGRGARWPRAGNPAADVAKPCRCEARRGLHPQRAVAAAAATDLGVMAAAEREQRGSIPQPSGRFA